MLFKDKTDQIVKYLFDVIAPRITQMAMSLQKENGIFDDQQQQQSQ